MQKIILSKHINSEFYSVNSMVLVLILTVATIGSNSLALGPIAPAIATSFALDVADILMASSAYGIGTAVSAFFLAAQIDRFGVRKVLLLSLAVICSSFFVSSVAGNLYFLVGSQLVAGLGAGVALPAVYSYAALIAPKGQENAITGRVLSGWTISLVVGVSLASVIADYLQWRWVYGFFTIIAVVSFFLILRLPAPDKDSGFVKTASTTWGAAFLPRARPLLLICLAYMAAFYGTYAFIGDHIHTVLDLPLSVGGFVAISYGLGFGVAVFGDPLIDRFGAVRTMPKAYLAIAVVYATLAFFSDHIIGLVLIAFLWGAANHFGVNLIVTGLSRISPTKRGALMGLYSGVTYLAAGISVFVFGLIYEFAGLTGAALTGAACAIFAALVAIWIMVREKSLEAGLSVPKRRILETGDNVVDEMPNAGG